MVVGITALVVSVALGRAAPTASPEPQQEQSAPATASVAPPEEPSGPATGTLITGSRSWSVRRRTDRSWIVQDEFDGSTGIVAAWFKHEQALAQTFTAPATGLQLVEFAPSFDYAIGEGAALSIHEAEEPR